MLVEDVPQANEIDRECFPEWPAPSYKREILFSRLSHYLVAWDRETGNPADHQAIEQRESLQRSSKIGQFLEKLRLLLKAEPASPSTTNQRIVGLAGLWIMADEAHLTTIGVREVYRRQGIGELLLIAALHLTLMLNARVLTLEVRASNHAAQKLYEKYGFRRVGLRRGYYSDNREDAVVMSTDSLTSASFQSHFQWLKQAHAQRWGPADCQIG
jgi:ribosomal-protein-alanine N-acetyltransferase